MFDLRTRLTLTEARLQAAEGHAGAARPRLERSIATCERVGFVGLALEGELALLEVERSEGGQSPAAMRRRAAALQQKALRRGFVAIADRAAASAVPLHNGPQRGQREREEPAIPEH
jgi:hypothetical protein